MSKLSKQDKIEIYNNWKYYHKSSYKLGREYGISPSGLRYLVRLIDCYGIQVLDRPYTNYSVEFKEQAIKRALSSQESKFQIALDLALPNRGMLHNWIRKYKKDGYNVINYKKGRPIHDRQRQTDQSSSKASQRLKSEEFKAYCRARIFKKIRCLSLPKK